MAELDPLLDELAREGRIKMNVGKLEICISSRSIARDLSKSVGWLPHLIA